MICRQASTTQASQSWAQRLWKAGFDGIYYAARHDPQFTERSVALFGRAGDQTREEGKRFELATSPIPPSLQDQMGEEFGLLVLPYGETPDPPG